MPRDTGLPDAEMVEDAYDVLREPFLPVSYLRGLVAQVVSPLVGDDNALASHCEWPDLAGPSLPEFGEAVQQHHKRSFHRTGRDSVKLHASRLELRMF